MTRSTLATSWAGRARCVALAGASILGLSGGAAYGDTPTVFHSDDGNDPGTVFELTGQDAGRDDLTLWFHAGTDQTQTGMPCIDGDGDETCGFHVSIELEGSGYFAVFTPAPAAGIVYFPETFGLGVKQLNANWLNTSGSLQSIFIGTLTVDTTAGGGSVVRVKGDDRVNASLQLEPIANEEIARTAIPTPEPGALLQLAAGISALVALHCLRGRARRGRR